MNLPLDFFRDEVRCGFWVPTAIKQAWAAQLTVLQEIDRICEKHGILYYAEWGTLLGAIRHRGFIPWDDDLDIGMRREDYERFRAVADTELPESYVIHDYERKEDHWLFLSRVVNREHFSFDPAELDRWHNYPWLAGIDIFVLDYRYRDEEKEKQREREVLRLIALADSIVEGRLERRDAEVRLSEIDRQYGMGADWQAMCAGYSSEAAFSENPSDALLPDAARAAGVALYRLAEQQMARTPEPDADRLVQMFPWGLKGAAGLPKEWYGGTVRLPFESTTIPVPVGYEDILTNRYGASWMVVRKVWGGHDYPSFEGQRGNLQKIADFELPEFRWNARMAENRAPLYAGATQEGLVTSTAEGMRSGILGAEVKRKQRKVLFLPIGPREWRGMQTYYEELSADPQNEISVVPLPIFFKSAVGEVTATDEEMLVADHFEEYPAELPLFPWYDYDPAGHHPAQIVIQNPYDGENPCLTVPPVFYAENLRQYTEELIYLPMFRTDEFGEADRNDQYNMKHYVTAPGVIWADRVLVQSANIRQQYIMKLTAFAGENTKALWEDKIQVAEAYCLISQRRL